MTDITTLPIPIETLDPAAYPEFKGEKGDTGDTGPQGDKGDKGDPGDPGTDAAIPAQASEAELLAGTETGIRSLSPANLVTAIEEHAPEGVTTFAALTDVDVTTTSPTEGQAPLWDETEEKWVPGTVAAEGGAGTKTIATFTWAESQPPAANFATLDTRNSIAVLDFGDTVTESTTFVDIIPEGMDLSSGILCRIHWGATTATSGDVRWGVQFEHLNTDMDADSYDTAALATSTTDATSGKKTITEITCTTIDSLAAGDLFRLRVYRDSADTATDTMVGDAELVGVELRGVA